MDEVRDRHSEAKRSKSDETKRHRQQDGGMARQPEKDKHGEKKHCIINVFSRCGRKITTNEKSKLGTK